MASTRTHHAPAGYPGAPRLRGGLDLRNLGQPRPDATVLRADERDYDELQILHSYRSYDPDNPGEVKYFVYHLSQQNPGESHAINFVKCVRFVRLTRVPRYLRQQGGGGANMVFEQQRDIIVSLRERGALFVNMIAKAPDLPLVFAYGVQGVGTTFEEAAAIADEGYAVLTHQLDGIYQQLEYKPIDVAEGESLSRYQQQWNQIAVARGRPIPASSTLGVSSLLDGNRTDVESTGNQLEAFIRGMGNSSFLLSLVTTPVSIPDILSAWQGLQVQLSRVRSDQSGSRGFSAGVALPIGFGLSSSDTHGHTDTSGTNANTTDTSGVSSSHALGTSTTHADGTSTTDTAGVNHSTSQTLSDGSTDSMSSGRDASVGSSTTHGDSGSTATSQGTNTSQTSTDSYSRALGVNQSSSLSDSVSQGTNWAHTTGTSISDSSSHSDGVSSGVTTGVSTGFAASSGTGTSLSNGSSQSDSSGFNPGIPGLSGSTGSSSGTNSGYSDSGSYGVSASSGSSQATSDGTFSSDGTSHTTGSSVSDSTGGSYAQATAATNSVGSSDTITTGTSLASGSGTSNSVTGTVGNSDSLAQSASAGRNFSSGTSLAHTNADGVSSGTSLSRAVGSSATDSTGTSVTDTSGTNTSSALSRGLSDSFATALSRSLGTTLSGGIAPTLSYNRSMNTFDEGKRIAGDVLAAQLARYNEGLKSGALMYQMFLTTPDRPTLLGAAGLLKSAFFGTGDGAGQLPQPFHVITEFPDQGEMDRLRLHAAAFTQYRKRNPYGEHIEPHLYSTFLTPSEAAALTHPPTSEAAGLLAVHDSMPVMAMPFHRQNKELYVGHVVNGERGRVSEIRYGLDTSEMDHLLVAGITGTGKTVTVNRLMSEVTRVRRNVPDPTAPGGMREVRAGVLALDWMSNLRDVAQMVERDRFQFFSVSKPHLGAFRYNVLALPDDQMNPVEWLDALADLLTAAFGLGDYGRSLLGEYLLDLYRANRLEPYVLLPAVRNEDTGEVLRREVSLPAVDASTLPPGAIVTDAEGNPVANVFTCPALSRMLSISDLATMVSAKMELAASPEGSRIGGVSMRDRLGSLWRRLQPFAPGNPLAEMLAADPDLLTRSCLTVEDLVDPDRGLVTVVEADGLDYATRRVVLGALVLAVFRKGMVHGDGFYNQNGKGPGTFLVLEEAHELLGEQGDDEDRTALARRTSLYEQVLRRSRALGMHVMVVVQNPSSISSAITSNISTVFVHRVQDGKDRQVVADMMSWSGIVGQQIREIRWLAEQPRGWCVVRNAPRDGSFLEAAPVQIYVEATGAARVRDDQLAQLAQMRQRNPLQ